MIFLRFRVLFFCLVLAGVARGAGCRRCNPEALQLRAQQVHDIFEAKCLDCHGPELPRPKGKFGYVLDLKRVAENPEDDRARQARQLRPLRHGVA